MKMISAAALAILVGAGFGATASAAPAPSFDDGLGLSIDDNPSPAGSINHGGAVLFGQDAAPGALMPVPQPALIPPLELDMGNGGSRGTQEKPADTDLPEPGGTTLLLGGLLLLGLTARRAGAQRR